MTEIMVAPLIYEDRPSHTWKSGTDIIDSRIEAALADMKTTLSVMACTSCGGNIDPQTLVCSCCGRQYRLEVTNA